MKLSILIPVYNDKDYIQKTIDQIRAVHFPIPYEIVAVDDASTDGSREILETIPHITKIFHSKNTGKGGAIATGLKHVTGDIIAIQDDDCEYDPAVLPQLITPIINNEADVVYGSRFLQKNSMFFIQRMENIAITALAKILIGHQLSDIESGHKVFSRAIANKIQLVKKGFEFDMEITLQFLRLKARIKELPTRYTARTHAQGKKITYKDGIRTIATLLKLTPKQRIMKFVLTIGFLTAVFLPRVVGLGHILTVDEPLWLSRGTSFLQAFSVGNFEKTLVAGQPGITTAWLVGISSPWNSLAAGQFAIGLACSVLILLNTYFFRILLGKTWGTLTGLFLALDPFLIAHTRIAHTDALLALFFLASIVSLLCAFHFKKIHIRYVVFSAVCAAAALLTKIFAVVVFPIVTITIAGIVVYRKMPWDTTVRVLGVWIGVCALTGFIAWPALWTHSEKVADLLLSRAEVHAEGTRLEETTSADWYYLRESFFRLSLPVAILLPFALWHLRKPFSSPQKIVLLYILITGLVFVLFVNMGSDKSDRYILYTHLSLIVLAPLACMQIKTWGMPVLAIAILFLVADDIRLHPYYLAHYNRLYPIEETHKLGWGEGLEQAAQWIEAQGNTSKVLSYYPRVFSYFYDGEVVTITHLDDADSEFIVVYRSMFERGPDAPETDIVQQFLFSSNQTPVHIVNINGIPYAWIFRR